MGEYSSEFASGGGCYNKLFWAKFSKIRILRPRSAQKNCSFTMFFGQNPPKTRYFSSKWAFFLICFIIWHLFLIIWQMFPKIIIFALQQIKIFQNHPLSKIRIFWKNIHPCTLLCAPCCPSPVHFSATQSRNISYEHLTPSPGRQEGLSANSMLV